MIIDRFESSVKYLAERFNKVVHTYSEHHVVNNLSSKANNSYLKRLSTQTVPFPIDFVSVYL